MVDSINSADECQSVSGATGVIYKITNTLNGKIYIGQTRRPLEIRLKEHQRNTSSSAVESAIEKYGWENFTVEVVEMCLVDKLNEREIFFIAKFNSKAPNGYNLTDGGDSGACQNVCRTKSHRKQTAKPQR